MPSLSNASATGDSWAAVYYGGMFRQVSGSSTWTPINNGLSNTRVLGFAVASSVSPYRAYVATQGGGVFKTVDGGANWTAVNSGLACRYDRSVQFVGVGSSNGIGATASSDRLLASTECDANSGVYLSTDGGATWSPTSGMSAGVLVQSVTRINPTAGIDFLMAATYDGVYKSTDNGLNWTLSNAAMTSPNGVNINNVTSLYNGSPAALTIYVAEANTGVWKSVDNGASWGAAPVLAKIPTAGITTDGNANGNLYCAADGEGVYVSSDRGATWSMFASSAVLPGARSIQRNTTVTGSPVFFAQTFAGIYQTTDGGATWSKTSAGLPGGYTINGSFDSAGNAYVAAAEGVYKATPTGDGFHRLGGYNLGIFGSGGHVVVTPTDVPYAITSHLGVFKYDGSNWVPKNAGLPAMARQGGQLRSDPKNVAGLYLGLANGGMYYSSDGGETWTARNNGLSGKAMEVGYLAVASGYALAATNGGLYKSTDTGTNWTRLPFAARSPANDELPISHLRIDTDNGNIYAAVNETDPAGTTYSASGVWKSTDGGTTWTQSLAGMQARDVSLARTASGVRLYAGLWDTVGGGALQSTDEGATWSTINSGLTTHTVSNFTVSGGILRNVLTLGDGAFSFTPPATAEALGIIPGWNLLGNGMSAPLNVAAVFNNANNVNTVWKWLPASSSWAFYAPSLSDGGAAYAAGKGYAFLTSIAAGEGFWVNAKAAFTQPLAGTAVTSASFQHALPAGWSLIATGDNVTPSRFNRVINTPPSVPGIVPISLTTLWAWDAAKANWYFYAPSLESSGGLSTYVATKSYLEFAERALSPTTGFWVNKP